VPDSSAFTQTESRPEVIEEIDTAALAQTWRQDFGVDVGPVFDGIPTLRLCRDRATNRVFFDPPVAGSPDFYAQLRRFDWYHPSDKAEHCLAGATIGPEDRVLDIGAGDGAFRDHVNGAAYEGLEFDPHSAQRARNRGRNNSGRTLSRVAAEVAGGTQQPYTVATAYRDTYVSALPDFALNAPPHHLTWWNAGSIRALLHGHGVRHLIFHWTPVEHWERRLWWMARVARRFQRPGASRFEPSRRRMKIFAWLMAGLLQAIKRPADVRGATLVATARKPDVI
jgi:hypothetical protein